MVRSVSKGNLQMKLFVLLTQYVFLAFTINVHAVGQFNDQNGEFKIIKTQLPIVKFNPEDMGSWNEDVRDGVVKVLNVTAPIWGGNMSGGHGTGFVVGIREKKMPDGKIDHKVVIFTNKHVIDKPRMHAQNLKVEFNVRGTRGDAIARPESVDADLLFVSEVLDFAVVEVSLSQIKRATPKILPVAPPGSPEYEFIPNSVRLRGTPTEAVGFPGDGDSIFTSGQVTGLWAHPNLGNFIQTDTPINPGNSGGPLISLRTGSVLGINSMTVPGRDGTHYVLPIKEVWEEFDVCEVCHNEQLARSKLIEADFVEITDIALKYMGLYATIESILPEHFKYFHSLLKVSRTGASSNLKAGDVILKIEGQDFPPTIFEFRKRLQRLKDKMHFTVLREGQVIDVDSKIIDSSFFEKRREVDYVYLSGLFLQNASARHRHWARPAGAPERVFVTMVDHEGSQYVPPIPTGSFITGARYESQKDTLLPIKSLFDLKQILKKIPATDRSIILQYHSAVTVMSNRGMLVPKDAMSGYPAVRPNPDEMPILLTRIVTPKNFSVANFVKKFDPHNPALDWSWQNEVVETTDYCKRYLDLKTAN